MDIDGDPVIEPQPSQAPAIQVNDGDDNKVDESELVKKYKRKVIKDIITEAGNDGGIDTRELGRKIGGKIQVKFKDAKKEAGKPHDVMMDMIDILESMGVVESTTIQAKQAGRGGDRYDVCKVELNDGESMMRSISGPSKVAFSELVKKYKLKPIFRTLAIKVNKTLQMKQLLDTIY